MELAITGQRSGHLLLPDLYLKGMGHKITASGRSVFLPSPTTCAVLPRVEGSGPSEAVGWAWPTTEVSRVAKECGA